MKIFLNCAANCINQGEPTQLSGCGIILRIVDTQKRVYRRELGFALGGSDLLLAQIQAARVSLSSVKSAYRMHECLMITDNKSIIDILNGHDIGEYKTAVSELHKWYSYYTNITILQDANDLQQKIAAQIAADAANNQVNHDSGSLTE